MRIMRWKRAIACVFVLSLPVSPSSLFAQYLLKGTLLASGGGVRTGNVMLYDAAGEAVTGSAGGTDYALLSGFWRFAGESSAVEVALEAFSASVSEEGVSLSWRISHDGRFVGVNIYRAGSDGEFRRINEESVPPEIGFFEDAEALPGRTYRYRIGIVALEYEVYSRDIAVSIPPKPLTLYQNYPNPFNPNTSIKFYVPERSDVSLEVFDVGGRLVRTLCRKTLEQGRYSFLWNGVDNTGRSVASGVYFYRLKAGKKVVTRKMVLLR